jgi:hypothetical protein
MYITEIDAALGNNCCLQIIETGFVEQFLGLSQDGGQKLLF